MNAELNMYEKKGIEEYRNKKWVWDSVTCCNQLYSNITNNMGEIPNLSDPEIFDFMQRLMDLKYCLIELIGRDSK